MDKTNPDATSGTFYFTGSTTSLPNHWVFCRNYVDPVLYYATGDEHTVPTHEWIMNPGHGTLPVPALRAKSEMATNSTAPADVG